MPWRLCWGSSSSSRRYIACGSSSSRRSSLSRSCRKCLSLVSSERVMVTRTCRPSSRVSRDSIPPRVHNPLAFYFAVKKFLTNLLIGLAAIQVKSEEEQISLLLEGFYDSLCSVSQLLYPLSQNLVLNAFRHHRNLHSSPTVGSTCRTRCSTPFGIIGIFTVTTSRTS
jgi:hypothetical protein